MMFNKIEKIKEFCEKNSIKLIDFKLINLKGQWHHLTIPMERFDGKVLEDGIGFDGPSYGFSTVEKSDMVFIPDLNAAFIDPFNDIPTLVFITNIYKLINGKRIRFEDDTRFITEKVQKYMKDSKIADSSMLGPEFEFYVLDHISYQNDTNHMEVFIDSNQAEWNSNQKLSQNLGLKVKNHEGYHLDAPFDSNFQFMNKVVMLLEENGVPVKYYHHEAGGPGQTEIEVNFASLLDMADRTMKLKYILRNSALRNNKTITFMPKPFADEYGTGMHVHLQLFKNGEPLFYDKNGYSQLSQTALHAIGGILKHAGALMPFTNPSTNSYKRLVPEVCAPVSICFGNSNKSAAIRIPGYATSPDKKRFEVRFPDAMANPYLAYSAILMAMIDGIKNEIDPTKEGFGPYDVNLFKLSNEEKVKIKNLPTNLLEAVSMLENDMEFLLQGDAFTRNIIKNQIKRVTQEHYMVFNLPHPKEFDLYYDL